MITAPLSIWKEEAYVRVRPIYWMLVAVMSHRAGGKKIRGLNLSGAELSSTGG